MRAILEVTYENIDGSVPEPAQLGVKLSNFYIVLDYNKNEDPLRDQIKFSDTLKQKGWKGMWVLNIEDAKKEITEYLGNNNQADNIVISSHGAYIGARFEDATGSAFFTDNNSNRHITYRSLDDYINCRDLLIEQQPITVADIENLINIVSKIRNGGKLFLASCHSAVTDHFLGSLQIITGSKINMYGIVGTSLMRYKSWASGVAFVMWEHVSKGFIHPDLDRRIKKFEKGWTVSSTSIQLKNLVFGIDGLIEKE